MSSLKTPWVATYPSAWQLFQLSCGTLWLKGHVFNTGEALRDLERCLHAPVLMSALEHWLQQLDGHFALTFIGSGSLAQLAFAAVDQIRSTPLFFVTDATGVVIGDHAPSLAAQCAVSDIDPVAARCLAMSGYTVGTDTLHSALRQLGPGQWLLANDGIVETYAYRRWQPWQVRASTQAATTDAAAEATLGVLDKLVRMADGRTVAIALSAGLDSRVIASGLRHLNAPDVRCYAYGLPGNYEAKASQAIAARLGYPWTFVPLTRTRQRQVFDGPLIADYMAFADSRSATPVLNDLTVTKHLLECGFIDNDTVMVNGNSGDFISGMHIAPALHTIDSQISGPAIRDGVVDALIDKHFRLWEALARPDHDQVIRARLHEELACLAPGDVEAHQRHGLYEAMEFRDRQSKFVIGRQRIYEYLGLTWALPLWDQDYLAFWECQPLVAKANQRLYHDMARSGNWGGVWGDGWRPVRRISPAWMRWLVRPLCKAAVGSVLGRAGWHRFERRFLTYWTDMLAWQSCLPYGQVVGDTRGARHFIAWHTERYLASLGLRFDGTFEPIPRDRAPD